MEQRIEELKSDLAADDFCLTEFFATEAAFPSILMLFNLLGPAKRDAERYWAEWATGLPPHPLAPPPPATPSPPLLISSPSLPSARSSSPCACWRSPWPWSRPVPPCGMSQLHQPRSLAQPQHLHEQLREARQVFLPKTRDRVVVRVLVRGQVPERQVLIGRPLDPPRTRHPSAAPIDQEPYNPSSGHTLPAPVRLSPRTWRGSPTCPIWSHNLSPTHS